MGPKKASKRSLSWQGVSSVLLVGTALCFTTLAAAAPQAPASQAAGTATGQAPAPQPPVAQAPPQTPQTTASMGQGGGQGPESVHIMVGHSLLIHSPSRIKRILTGNPTIIESVLTSPRELVVTAKATGGSSLMVWDEAGQNRTLDVYADLDVSSLRNTLDQSFPGSNVDVQSEADKVTLVGIAPSPAVAEQMLKMAGNFSKEVVNGLQIAQPPRQKQVMLKVRFAEADRSKLSAFAFNLFSTGASNTIGTVTTQQFGPLSLQSQQGGAPPISSTPQQFSLTDLLNIFVFRPDINLGFTLKALQQKNVLQILAEPNLMAISGQPAHFLAGGEFPYPVIQNAGVGGVGAAITIQFRPYGVKLEFVGTIEDNDTIRLKVAPEVSSLDYSNTVTISGFTMPAIQTRRAETEIELKNGQSFGIAGLLDERTTVQLNKIPGIGDVPILGELFKSRNINKTNTELIVLVTPTVVDPVAGQVESPQPQVNMPVQSLDTNQFDKGLPGATVSPEKK